MQVYSVTDPHQVRVRELHAGYDTGVAEKEAQDREKDGVTRRHYALVAYCGAPPSVCEEEDAPRLAVGAARACWIREGDDAVGGINTTVRPGSNGSRKLFDPLPPESSPFVVRMPVLRLGWIQHQGAGGLVIAHSAAPDGARAHGDGRELGHDHVCGAGLQTSIRTTS